MACRVGCSAGQAQSILSGSATNSDYCSCRPILWLIASQAGWGVDSGFCVWCGAPSAVGCSPPASDPAWNLWDHRSAPKSWACRYSRKTVWAVAASSRPTVKGGLKRGWHWGTARALGECLCSLPEGYSIVYPPWTAASSYRSSAFWGPSWIVGTSVTITFINSGIQISVNK